MRRSIMVVTVTALMLTLACVTVNVYFPAAEVQQAADRIEEEVRGEQASMREPGFVPQESMLRRLLREAVRFEGRAYAQIDIDVTTPNIRALIESRAKRFPALRPLYGEGIIGETNDGQLSIRSIEGLGLKERAEANKLVKDENKDRNSLYLEIAEANDIPSDSVPDIQKLFANSMRKRAAEGWWVQKDNGEWVKKSPE